MYDVYYHKQNPVNPAESPQSNLGMTSSPNLDDALTTKSALGYSVIAAQVIPAGKQVFNSVVTASGNVQTQRTLKNLGKVVGFGVAWYSVRLPLASLTAITTLTVDFVTTAIDNYKSNVAQNYEVQKRGVAINNFVGTGERYD